MSAPDPFGFWQAAPARPAGEVSYTPGEAPPEETAAVWSIDVRQAGSELARREAAVKLIDAGLEQAGERLERFFDTRGETGRQVSYAQGPTAENMLLLALSEVDPERFPPGGAVSYGWTDLLKWDEMRARFKEFADLANRQLLHFVWVDTSENERIIARTKINWASDLKAFWTPGITAQQVAIHERSLEAAVRYRAENLRIYLQVIQMAMRILRAVSTPLGVLDALALAYQFLLDVIQLLKREQISEPASG